MFRLVGTVLAEQNDEWAEARRGIGPETLTVCRKTSNTTEANETSVAIDAISA